MRITAFRLTTRSQTQEVRELIRSVAPAAIETMSYAIPTFDLNGKHLVHFAGYAKHIGFYRPLYQAFGTELDGYTRAQGSVQFRSTNLPVDTIRRMVGFRVAAMGGAAT
ncbi:MAG: DUF1801 domain-containing protein [Caldilineaceae bacterium]